MATVDGTVSRSPLAFTKARCEPRLAYDDENGALAFLTAAFGFRELTRMAGPDDSFMAWLGFGDGRLMIGRSGREHHNLYSPRQSGKPTGEINVSVDDIDSHYERARAAGAVIGTPLQDAPWGYRHYEAVDLEGHGWHFLKPLEDLRNGKATPERLELRLAYADEHAALEFLTAAFGFREEARIDTTDGSAMVWLGLGDAIVMITRADAAEHQHSPRETGMPTAMVNLHVDEIDAHYRRAVNHGARIVTELDNTPWGFRRYEALDPEGNRWHVMRKLT
jgi:uncharacterized glyoxalase superfamily protein PhnB